MLKKFSYAAAAVALTTTTALAGSMDAPVEEPVVTYAAVPAATPDWTGGYVGGEIGYVDVGSSPAGLEGDGLLGGLVAGYDFDMGNWVAGVGVDYDWADVDLGGGVSLDSVLRVKARGGYKMGSGLLYATAGYANADTNTLGSSDGWVAGAGYEHQVSSSFNVGIEALYHEFSDFNGSGVDVDATTVQLRGTYRF
ncbi:outer membrane beta-barrel protein [Aliiroseovarius sediminis]|uniref:outer membrane protein n=1 Tax=Aliiroseovarius sediminis TaxID=2925839 RepID=UPI001F565CF5|nr:outer membrane beta-barrel protein [Aliiroseovarius sediminis]MCI2395090.1 porin family protein [Aliiroseovarius sediminis]